MCPTLHCMEDFKERLLSFIQTKGMSIRRFEETCGLTNGTIGSIKAQGPTAYVVSKISDTFRDLDLNWLFRGDGTMLIRQSVQPGTPVQNDIHHNDTVNINYVALKDAIVDAIRESRENGK